MTLAAEPKLDKLPTLSDIGAEHPLHEQLQVVLSNGWMRAGAAFAWQQPVTRKDWALACKALVERFHNTTLEKAATLNDLGQLDAELAEAARLTVGEGWLKAEQGRFEPEAPVSRGEVAQTLARIAGLLKS